MEQTFMKKQAVLPLVLSMSLPMVISMLVNSLYNIIDSYFVAKISENAMTALSLVFPLQNLVNAVSVGFGIGINAVAAYYLGAQDDESANHTISQGIVLSAVHGLVLMIGCMAAIPAFLRFFTTDEEIISLGVRYSYIVFAFSIIITVEIAFEKIFQSVGRMVVSMVSMMCGCITNIILDPILIFGLGPVPSMGIEGAALATGIGQLMTIIIYIGVYLIKPLPVHFEFKNLLKQQKVAGRIYAVGIPAALNMALPSLLVTALNAILSSFSDMYVLILGIYYKLQTFIYLTANGIVQGIRPLVGYNFGAREYGRVKTIYKTALILAMIVMAAGMILCLTIPGQLMGMFTENKETIQAGSAALRIICMGFVLSSISVISSGTLEGIGKGTPSLVISLMRYLVIIIPAAFILSRFMEVQGVWHAFWITESITSLVSFGIYKITCKKMLSE